MLYYIHNDIGGFHMSIVYQKDKRSGITYVYESKSWWDKEKKQSRSKRRLIGRLDEVTGTVIPTDGRCKKSKEKPATITDELPNKIISCEPITNEDYKKLYEKEQRKCRKLEKELEKYKNILVN